MRPAHVATARFAVTWLDIDAPPGVNRCRSVLCAPPRSENRREARAVHRSPGGPAIYVGAGLTVLKSVPLRYLSGGLVATSGCRGIVLGLALQKPPLADVFFRAIRRRTSKAPFQVGDPRFSSATTSRDKVVEMELGARSGSKRDGGGIFAIVPQQRRRAKLGNRQPERGRNRDRAVVSAAVVSGIVPIRTRLSRFSQDRRRCVVFRPYPGNASRRVVALARMGFRAGNSYTISFSVTGQPNFVGSAKSLLLPPLPRQANSTTPRLLTRGRTRSGEPRRQ